MERGQSSRLSTWSEEFILLSSQLNGIKDWEWKSNQKQCSVLRFFLIDTVVQYITQWWRSLFPEETQSNWADEVGRELVGVLERGIWLLKLCCEMDWFTTSVIIPSGPAEFCEIVDDMKRYAHMMNMLIQDSPLDSDRKNVVKCLQNKIDSDTSIMKMTLIWASKQDQNVLLQSLSKSDKLKRSLKPLFGGQFPGPAEPNIDYADLQIEAQILGGGTFGTVFRAKCFDNLLVAVKEFSPDDPSFDVELRLLMKFQASDSSHILRVLGHSIDRNGRKQLVLELMEKDLNKIIQEKIGFLQSIDIIIQIAKAMKHVHESNVIYRDMKPSNILLKRLDDQYLVKLADFGHSKEHNEADTSHTYLRGTLRYMAPEMLELDDGRESGEYNNKVDVYSFGITCSEILTRKKPFFDKFKNSRKSMKELLGQGERPELTEEIPFRLQNLLKLCWEQEANNRPDFAYILEELWHVKEEFLAHKNGESGYVSKREGISELKLKGDTHIGGMMKAKLRLDSEHCLLQWFREDKQGNVSIIKNKLLKGRGEIEDVYKVTAYDVGFNISVKCFGVESTTVYATYAKEITGQEIFKRIMDRGKEFHVKIDGGELFSNHKLIFNKHGYLLVWRVQHHLSGAFNKGAKVEADQNYPLMCTVTTERQQTYRLQFKTIEERNQAVSDFEVMRRLTPISKD